MINCGQTILNGDDIKHCIYIMSYIDGVDQTLMIEGLDFVATYYTDTLDDTYIVSKLNGVYTNCYLSKDKSMLVILLQNYNLNDGDLYCKIEIRSPDLHCNDGFFNITKKINLGMYLSSDINDVTQSKNKKISYIRLDSSDIELLSFNNNMILINDNFNSLKV